MTVAAPVDVDQDFFDHCSRRSFSSLPPPQLTLKPTMAAPLFPSPTPDDTEDLLLIARYGELDELKSFIEKFGPNPLTGARDEDGNTVLHMVCGNGHLGSIDLGL